MISRSTELSSDRGAPARGAARATARGLPARLYGPRYWPTWLGLGVVRLIGVLPYRVQMAVGAGLVRMAWCFARRDRRIADINIGLCLPELDQRARRRLVREHFASLGCALLETALVWWASDRRLRKFVRVEGLEHLERALARGRGAILLSAHFTTLEMGARALCMHGPTAIMYQAPRNALIAELSVRKRAAHARRAIASDNVRELLQSLKQNLPVWYAPDQRDEGRSAAWVPFFGVPALTNVATSRIARISGAPVLPYFPERLARGAGYCMHILPILENLPSEDPVNDAARFHALIEAQVRRCPPQYLWTYKRFKRPGAGDDPYRR
jgi:KDO2-lipid IV(A) lauroyltransferase